MKKLSLLFLPLLFLAYVATETYLKLGNSSICEADGCKLAGALVKFDAIYLNYLGLATGIVLVIFGILSYLRKIDEKLFYALLYAAILFETVMIGYQYLVSPKMCLFCLGVYGFLLSIALFANPKKFDLFVPSIIAVLMALSFLKIPNSTSFVKSDGYYLLHSPTCPHCKKVKEFFKEQHIEYTKVDIENIEAYNFLKFIDISTIPVLVQKDGKSINILEGDKSIINYFDEAPSSTEEEPAPQEEDIPMPTSILDTPDTGCGVSLIQKKEKCKSSR